MRSVFDDCSLVSMAPAKVDFVGNVAGVARVFCPSVLESLQGSSHAVCWCTDVNRAFAHERSVNLFKLMIRCFPLFYFISFIVFSAMFMALLMLFFLHAFFYCVSIIGFLTANLICVLF